jgi:hypothetical protein
MLPTQSNKLESILGVVSATDLAQYPSAEIILILRLKDGLLKVICHLRNRFGRCLYELCPERYHHREQ